MFLRYRQLLLIPSARAMLFCGGFMVGWHETGDLQIAGLYGAVSASFLVEQIGLPTFSQAVSKEAQNRLDRHRSRLEVYALPQA